MLARRVGVQHIEAVEDAVQGALMAALESWTTKGLPDNPSSEANVYKTPLPNTVVNGQLRLLGAGIDADPHAAGLPDVFPDYCETVYRP